MHMEGAIRSGKAAAGAVGSLLRVAYTCAMVVAAESLWAAWSFQPLVLGMGVVAVAFFLHGWVRLHRRRAELAPWTRIPCSWPGCS